jgi:hypothetical protein
MMMSTLYWINTCTLSWIWIVLVHWNNSSRTDLSLHSDTPSVFFMYFIFINFYTRTLPQNVCVVMITTILVNWRLFRHYTQWLSCKEILTCKSVTLSWKTLWSTMVNGQDFCFITWQSPFREDTPIRNLLKWSLTLKCCPYSALHTFPVTVGSRCLVCPSISSVSLVFRNRWSWSRPEYASNICHWRIINK